MKYMNATTIHVSNRRPVETAISAPMNVSSCTVEVQGLLGVQRDVAVHTYRLGISNQSAECYVLGVVLKA